MPGNRIDEMLISTAFDIAATVSLDDTADDEEFDTLDKPAHSSAIVSANAAYPDVETHHSHDAAPGEPHGTVLKRDLFGKIVYDADQRTVIRDTSTAARWVRPLARRLASREAHIICRTGAAATVPTLIERSRDRVVRTFLSGEPMHAATFDARPYFRDALRQLRRLHAQRIAHNDLAKEANWICMPGNRAGIVDFQIALHFSRRSRVFRTLAWEDLRHLLKHKQHYADELLTRRQRRILSRPMWTSRFWRSGFKPLYRLVTRRLLGWPERNSALEREI